jgi:hypothetical protein
MGIFKKLINKVLDTEVPPAVEKLVKKGVPEEKKSDAAPFSMKIEDVFSIHGSGTVVCGKIDAGSIKLNDEITIIGGGKKQITKIVSIEKSNKLMGEAKSGDSVGLLLDKIKQNEVKKNYIITKGENVDLAKTSPQIGPVIYSEREIPDDSEEVEQIREAQQQWRNTILNGMIARIEKSPYFKAEKKQGLIDVLKKNSKLHDPFSYDDCLTAAEKRALGLNTRLKISRQMIEFLTDEGLKLENPKEIINFIYHNVLLKQSALENQKQKQEIGLKLYVWETSGDERVCEACKRMDQKLCRWDDPTVYSEDGGKTWKPRSKGAILMHPGHHEGCPGYYENCRCTAAAYYPELAGEL